MLDHTSFDRSSLVGRSAPRSWFLNLEPLFENAVRKAVREVLGHPVQVEAGARWRRPVVTFPAFDDGADERTTRRGANPDVVAMDASDVALLVGDAKYKTWTGKTHASDLYQLLVHTAAFDGSQSVLFFPNHRFEHVYLGYSAVGSEVRIFGVDLQNMRDSIERALDLIGVRPATTTAT
jgi:hypothetical protein